MSRRYPILLACLLLLPACGGSPSGPGGFPALDADFSDGTISTEQFEFAGGVSEAGGLLQLRRESPDDYLRVRQLYGRNWQMTLEIRLNSIHWNDMFHGLSARDDEGNGISFGFSRHGKFFLSRHVASEGGGMSTSTSYGPDGSNEEGSWRTVVLSCVASRLTIEVDGSAVDGIEAADLPRTVRFELPGRYEDGDGGDMVGVTSSDIRVLRIEPL